MSPNSDNRIKIALIRSELISDYEIEHIVRTIESIQSDKTRIELSVLQSNEMPSSESNFDLFVCIHDDDVLNIVRESKELPPVLCIELPGDNSYFSQITLKSLDWALKNYLLGNYIVDVRDLLQLNTKNEVFLALNDIHLTSSAVNKRIRYDIRVDGEPIYTDGSDSANAILICTPTGSTAMSFNVGGAVIHPKSPVFQIISIASRNITTHHQIIPQNSFIEVEILEAIYPLVINVDNFQFNSTESTFNLAKATASFSLISFLENPTDRQSHDKLKAKLAFEDTQSLTSTAKFLLYVLKNNQKPTTINELISTTHLQNQKTVRNALNLLMSKGFVKRRENYTDMREYLYYYSLPDTDELELK